MKQRKKIRFGIIGLGLMGKEFGSAVARWCHLLDDGPIPVILQVYVTKRIRLTGSGSSQIFLPSRS